MCIRDSDTPAGHDWLGKTVHLVAGAAGCRENTDPWLGKPGHFSATRLNGYGFGLLSASRTELAFEQVNHATGEVVDSFTITKPTSAFAEVED